MMDMFYRKRTKSWLVEQYWSFLNRVCYKQQHQSCSTDSPFMLHILKKGVILARKNLNIQIHIKLNTVSKSRQIMQIPTGENMQFNTFKNMRDERR